MYCYPVFILYKDLKLLACTPNFAELHKRLSKSALNNTFQTTNNICCRFSVVITVVITQNSQGFAKIFSTYAEGGQYKL